MLRIEYLWIVVQKQLLSCFWVAANAEKNFLLMSILRKPTRVKNNNRKFYFSRTNEDISRRNEKFSRSNEKYSRSNEKSSRSNENISRSNEKNSRRNEKLSRRNENISRRNEN